MTRKSRAPRRDDEVDAVRTIFWFQCLGERLGKHEARAIQRAVAPDTIGVDDRGEPIKNGKFLAYERGERTPSTRLVEQIEQQVPRSARNLDHPLWQVFRTSKPIKTSACHWVRQLDPEIGAFGAACKPG